jgi:hypothetical protein
MIVARVHARRLLCGAGPRWSIQRSCDFVALRYCQFPGLDQITMTAATPATPSKAAMVVRSHVPAAQRAPEAAGVAATA